MSFNIEVEGGKSVRLPTSGKYCDRDIFVTAKGGGGEGYDQGYAEGEKVGYNKGYAEGEQKGHESGYADGEQAATAAAEAHNAIILADCNAILPTKGVEPAETLEQVPDRIEEIETGGGGSDELIFETTFSIAESIQSTTTTTVATISTGLTVDSFAAGDFYRIVIKCINDAETDMSFSHFRERIQHAADAGGGYFTANTNDGITYFYRADLDAIVPYGGLQRGVFVSSLVRYAASLTVKASGGSTNGGYAVAGDYSVKLYKVNIGYYGLEGV